MALSAYLAFVVNVQSFIQLHGDVSSLALLGRQHIDAARIATILPLGKASTQQMAAIARASEDELKALEEKTREASKINDEHKALLRADYHDLGGRVKGVEAAFTARLERLQNDEEVQRARTSDEFGTLLIECRDQHNDEMKQLRADKEKLVDEFADLTSKYKKHLQYYHPIRLWTGLEAEHSIRSERAQRAFWGMIAFTAIFAFVVVHFFGEDIAKSFTHEVCGTGAIPFCRSEFSFKGPLTTASLLMMTSLLLWIVRQQNKIFLSERHLALNARERRAFAETYLALRAEDKVGSESEAIVLGALFRSSPDGIVKEEEGGFDVSMAAVIAKQLSPR
jgi:hypothetical protein